MIINYSRSINEEKRNKLMFTYLENNERNILKMEKDIEEINFLIRSKD